MFTRTPDWFRDSEAGFVRKEFGRLESLDSEAALVCTFEAEAYGDTKPGASRSIQDEAIEALRVAILALAIAKPSALHIEAISVGSLSPSRDGTSAFSGRRLTPFFLHPAYADAKLKKTDLKTADAIATGLRSTPRGSALWTAARFLALALSEELWEIRLLNLWVGIEALFGPEDREGITKSLGKRIARFLNPTDDDEGRRAYRLVVEGYDWRCAVSHGARTTGRSKEDIQKRVLESESVLVTTLRRILLDPASIAVFTSSSRDSQLKKLAAGFIP